MTPYARTILFVSLSLLFTVGRGESPQVTVQIEAGPAWFTRNDARIPGDGGDTFDMTDLTGTGPEFSSRISLTYAFNPVHSLRLTYVPVSTEGTGMLERDTRFEDTVFSAADPVKGEYVFNTTRLGYRWNFLDDETWTLGIGGLLLVRDAEISLSQGGVKETNDDLGVVPLFGFYADAQVADSLSLHFDAEGLASPYGRAFDVALQARWALNDTWDLLGSLRTIEGGADNDDVYTFAWITFAHLGIAASF